MEKREATKRQTFALWCITKKDYRGQGLTFEDADKLIKELSSPDYKTKRQKAKGAMDIHSEAYQAGIHAAKACRPTPMIVQQHASPLNDNSKVIKEWICDGGVCGFASIWLKATTPENRAFINGLKKLKVNPYQKNSYQGGYSYYVHEGGQSLQIKEAFAHAYVEVLHKYKLTAYIDSRMD